MQCHPASESLLPFWVPAALWQEGQWEVALEKVCWTKEALDNKLGPSVASLFLFCLNILNADLTLVGPNLPISRLSLADLGQHLPSMSIPFTRLCPACPLMTQYGQIVESCLYIEFAVVLEYAPAVVFSGR